MWPRWGLAAVHWLQDTQEWGPPRSSEKGVWLEPRSRRGSVGRLGRTELSSGVYNSLFPQICVRTSKLTWLCRKRKTAQDTDLGIALRCLSKHGCFTKPLIDHQFLYMGYYLNCILKFFQFYGVITEIKLMLVVW